MTTRKIMSSKTNKLFKELVSKYRGKWISVSEDYSNIYAHSRNFDKLIEKLNKDKPKKGIIIKIPSQKYSAYVG